MRRREQLVVWAVVVASGCGVERSSTAERAELEDYIYPYPTGLYVCPRAGSLSPEECAPPQDAAPVQALEWLELRLVTRLGATPRGVCAATWRFRADGATLAEEQVRVDGLPYAVRTVSVPLRGLPEQVALTATLEDGDPSGALGGCGVPPQEITLDLQRCPSGLHVQDASTPPRCVQGSPDDLDDDGVLDAAAGGPDCDDTDGFGSACLGIEAEEALLAAPTARLTELVLPATLPRSECLESPLEALRGCSAGEVPLGLNQLLHAMYRGVTSSPGGYVGRQLEEGRFALGSTWLDTAQGPGLILYNLDPPGGDGLLWAQAASLEDAAGDYPSALPGVDLSGEEGELVRWESAAPGRLRLGIAFGGGLLRVPLQAAVGKGSGRVTSDGLALEGVTIYGVAPVRELRRAINDYIEETCGCLNASQDLYRSDGTCGAASSTRLEACRGDARPLCASLAEQCATFNSALIYDADADLTGDGTPGSFSAAIRLEAAPATLEGVR